MKPLLAIATLLSLAGAARADTTVAVGSNVRGLHAASADALTGDSLSGGEVAVAYRLPVELVPRLAVWADAAYVGGSVSGSMFQTITTETSIDQLTLGAQARYAVIRHVVAFARAGVGTARDAVRVSDTTGRAASDHAWGGVATGALGVELWAVDRPTSRFDLGLRFGVAYTLASAVALAPAPEHPDDGTLRLPAMQTGFGALDLSGASFGGGLVGRF